MPLLIMTDGEYIESVSVDDEAQEDTTLQELLDYLKGLGVDPSTVTLSQDSGFLLKTPVKSKSGETKTQTTPA